MGAMWFDKGELADHLHELIGYKAGIAVSIEDMCDLLSETPYANDIMQSEEHEIRIRSESYEDIYYNVLHKVGLTDRPYNGMLEICSLFQDEFMKPGGQQFVADIWHIFSFYMKIKDEFNGNYLTEMILKAKEKYGLHGMKSMYQLIEEYERLMSFTPHSEGRWRNWSDIIQLSDLFIRFDKAGNQGVFFDQRFIDFLAVNQEKLGSIHWRKFEELVGECFINFGFKVEIGPGSGDDGIDLRVWNDEKNSLEFIIQCKREKGKIEKVVVKGLYTDVLHENAKQGLLVTTSELSLGARKTISSRAYPIQEVNGEMIKKWLVALRTPGSGIIRI